MPSSSQSRVKYNTPLRQARRNVTRDRIKNAARTLFHARHYDSTTMDEIALAAGLGRSTLYLHYREKAEILSDIIGEYAPKARAVLASLPGPRPSLMDVASWVQRVVSFVRKECVPLSIILELRHRNERVEQLEELTRELLAGLGENNPPFRFASSPDADPMLRARGLLLLQELTYACEIHLADTSDSRGKAMLRVTAEDFCAFLSAGD